MPEASMHENNLLETLEYQVGLPRKASLMKAKTIPEPVGDLSYAQFWFGILAPHQRHPAAALSLAEGVHGPSQIRIGITM